MGCGSSQPQVVTPPPAVVQEYINPHEKKQMARHSRKLKDEETASQSSIFEAEEMQREFEEESRACEEDAKKALGVAVVNKIAGDMARKIE